MIGDVILKQDDRWLKFTHPHRMILTEKLDEVREGLEEVERLVNENGWTAAGFVSYEAAPAFDPSLRVRSTHGFPLLWFGLYEAPQIIKRSDVFHESESLPALSWQPDIEKETYNEAIRIIKDRIAHGKTYQVNYTMRLNADFEADAWTLFLHLTRSQNKYAAYLDVGDWAICSASHELFFDLDGEVITSRPMKGTVKRGRTLQEDAHTSAWLRGSVKNRAENVMIVDMIRNDLGRIAKVGSVHVPELFTIETYPTLFQMTSTVKAQTKAAVAEIFSALFPCASITGAPKVSTMNIIAELESSPRRIYTGSIGYIAPNRKSRFNVAIRTALVDKQNSKAEYGVGGGIVWDSTSADEYGEALLKARVLTEPPQKEFSLFETLLWTPEEGFFLLERHLARIMNSAKYFGFVQKDAEKKINDFLGSLVATANAPQRVKLLMDSFGELSGEVKDFQASEKVFQVYLAKEAVNSDDRFLFHKTTNRTAYDQAAMEGCDDVLLCNENGELTEFTIGNLVVKMDDGLFTPPVECGLLAGNFRAELLANGEIKEKIIRVEDLKKCREIFLVNSLRKWVRAELKMRSIE
ncbi:MAG TPA: aminodeoxychorismate synthase component I [Anaerolineales bacterium]|nr:aminodeoxychorismate synthase component I [Anaerolineales bacterium]